MKIKLFFLLFTLTVFSQSKIKLQTGDIIFQKMNCGELCDAIHAVTKGYKDNDFSHLGLVLVENDSVFVIEAGGNAVRKVTLEQFSTYTKTTMFVGRLKRKYRKYIPQAINFS
ncbi:MAG TPA: YiiX/YebB-like N1pC/P60 family cysteine hydrolase, partial [Flavobacterium sp.]|nr:YiiX/YebB-like N1pC/P60 family cysteine hydrolase [Flavobacterium sp.]